MPEEQKPDRRYDLIVWDWDGTIMDSTPTIVNCIQQACRDLGFKEPDSFALMNTAIPKMSNGPTESKSL